MRSNSNEEPKNRIDHSQPKDPKPLLAAMKAGATYYYKDGALVLDFKTIKLPDDTNDIDLPDFLVRQMLEEKNIRTKARQKEYFERAVEHLRETEGLPISAVNAETLTIHATGPQRMTLLWWFRENNFSPNLKLQEDAGEWIEPQIIRPKASHNKTAPQPKIEKTRHHGTASSTATKEASQQSGIQLGLFVKELSAIATANQESPEVLCKTIINFRTAIQTLATSPAKPTEQTEEAYENELLTRLDMTRDQKRMRLVQSVLQEMIDDAHIKGTISLNKIASEHGFHLTLSKPLQVSHGVWKEKAEALGKLLAMLQPASEQKPKINISNVGNTVIVKGLSPQSTVYRMMESLNQQQVQVRA